MWKYPFSPEKSTPVIHELVNVTGDDFRTGTDEVGDAREEARSNTWYKRVEHIEETVGVTSLGEYSAKYHVGDELVAAERVSPLFQRKPDG